MMARSGMDLNQTLIEIFSSLVKFGDSKIRKSIKIADGNIHILRGKDTLVLVSRESIKLFGEHHIQEKITVDGPPGNTVHLETVQAFFNKISSSITGLNHVGIGYSCPSYQTETKKFIDLCNKSLSSNTAHLFEENSENPYTKWFYIGDRSGSPLFELVLTQKKDTLVDKWTPQFQIDIDTSLEPDVLESICKSTFGTGFDWHLDVPGAGVVLFMKILGSINGTKICLGVGTSKRDTQYHREKKLQEVM